MVVCGGIGHFMCSVVGSHVLYPSRYSGNDIELHVLLLVLAMSPTTVLISATRL